MELRLLRYFLAVARESTITKAAESLHISAVPINSAQRIRGHAGQTAYRPRNVK